MYIFSSFLHLCILTKRWIVINNKKDICIQEKNRSGHHTNHLCDPQKKYRIEKNDNRTLHPKLVHGKFSRARRSTFNICFTVIFLPIWTFSIQSEIELWIKKPAPTKPAITIALQRNFKAFDCVDPIRDRPWIVDVAKNSLTTSIAFPFDLLALHYKLVHHTPLNGLH